MNTKSAMVRRAAGASAAFLLFMLSGSAQGARAQHDQDIRGDSAVERAHVHPDGTGVHRARDPHGDPDDRADDAVFKRTNVRSAATDTVQACDRETHPHTDAPSRIEEAFVRDARVATSRYHDVEVAIASGYRRMGPDMPNMGEHWIQPSMAARGSLDPSRPPVLTYLTTDSGKVLTGVAFTAPVRPGEAPPKIPLEAEWHFHTGGLEEEAFGHTHTTMDHSDEDQTRLAMIHAWIWVDNPDGTFAADNWALPFVRLGISGPSQAAPCAAKAAFLLSGGVDYYTRMAQTAAKLTPTELAAVQTTLELYRLKVREMLAAARGLTLDLEALSQLWSELWGVVGQNVNENSRRELSILTK